MKNLFYFLVVVAGFISCSTNKPDSNFVLKGKILNPADDIVYITVNERTDTVKADSGIFIYKQPLSGYEYIELRHGQAIFQVFAAPGENVEISFDYTMPDQVPVFTGSLGGENNYVAERINFDNQQIDLENSLYTSLEDDFMALNDSLRKLRIQMLDEAKEDFKSYQAKDFIAFESELIKIKWINKYLEYELYFPYLSGISDYKPSEKFLAYRKEINPNDSKYLILDEYVGMLEYYIEINKKNSNTIDLSLLQNNEELIRTQFALIDKLISDEQVRAEVKYRSVDEYLQVRGVEGLEKFYSEYIATVHDSVKKAKLDESFKKWDNIKAGETAPDIKAIDINGKKVSLTALKGKYVYIDFWATWCGPCKEEIPALDSIIDEFSGRDINFLSVSIDDSRESWMEMVKEANLKGLQWYGDKNELSRNYNIVTIPRYILIDREGRIISSNAERPSGNIRKVLEELAAKDKVS